MENDDHDKNLTVEKDDAAVVSVQKEQRRENNRASVSGRPNIDEISKRNEEAAKQERKSFYTVTEIIVLLIIVDIFLVYFFVRQVLPISESSCNFFL